MKRPNKIALPLVVFFSVTLPYLLAFLAGGQDFMFTGFLINPIDGASYLAKMYQGSSGAWQFTLPFSAEPGQGAYLFLFYLFLGHLAKWFGLPLILVFHGARLISAGLLLLTMDSFFRRVLIEHQSRLSFALWLAAFGSGLGWLLLFAGQKTSDFWVAEAYPFLSMYANPHFPLGLALLLWSFILLTDPRIRWRLPFLAIIGLFLSIILPFGEVVAVVIGLAATAWSWFETRKLDWQPAVCLGLLGGPSLLYQYWAALTNPALVIWNAQNLTPSPPLWDFLISFSPAILLAPFGIRFALRQRENHLLRLAFIWLVLGLVLVYFPFSLQRRFMLGFYLPATVFAVIGLSALQEKYPRPARWIGPGLIALSLPTTLLLVIIGLSGVMGKSPVFYLSSDEARALEWIRGQTPERALILAAPETGLWIPGYTGRRVLYGHPFETIHAAQEQGRVEDFFRASKMVHPGDPMLSSPPVEYIVYGPREKQLGGTLDFSLLEQVFNAGTVQIYAVQKAP